MTMICFLRMDIDNDNMACAQDWSVYDLYVDANDDDGGADDGDDDRYDVAYNSCYHYKKDGNN